MRVREPVLIVGSGPSGLVTAHHLTRRRIPCRVLEQAGCVAASFAAMRPGMSLVSPRAFSDLPGLPLPPHSPRFVPMRDYHSYLVDYARRLDLPVELRAGVREARRDDGLYRLTDGSGRTLESRFLVAATGVYSTPDVPSDLGLAGTSIPWLHAREYAGPDPYRGSSVLVVGAGISGQEVCLDLAGTAARVALSGRRPLRVMPNPFLCVDVHYFAWLPEKLRVRWAPWLVPRAREGLSGPAIRDALATGRVSARPAVVRIARDAVEFADGHRERFDAVVLATGYRPTIDWLSGLAVAGAGRTLAGIVDCESATNRDLFFVGQPFVRTFASRYLRGLRDDAEFVAHRIAERW
jgi:putative flavoprotein involved in K+ transport